MPQDRQVNIRQQLPRTAFQKCLKNSATEDFCIATVVSDSRDKFYINSSRQTQQHVQLIQLDSGFGAPWWPQLTARSKPPVTSTTSKAECCGYDSTDSLQPDFLR
jgi:hypothetical protein